MKVFFFRTFYGLHYGFVNFRIKFLCLGKDLKRNSLVANSKSEKSNPGDTVQPINAKDLLLITSAANQLFFLITV